MTYLMSSEQFSGLMRPQARNDDKLVFKLWEMGSIDTDECCQRFILHNGHKPEEFEFISLDAFRSMLEGLGYRRIRNG